MAMQTYSNFISDFCFERSLVMSRMALKGRELMLYEDNYFYLKEKLNLEKMVIFLHGDKKRIVENIKKRGRPNEENVSIDYIDKCQQALFDDLENLGANKIIEINIEQMDIFGKMYGCSSSSNYTIFFIRNPFRVANEREIGDF